MPAERPEVPSDNKQPPQGKQRLRLIESYSAFGDERLKDISDKIQSITSRVSPPSSAFENLQTTPPSSPDDSPDGSPNGSPNGSPSRSGENIGESSGDPLGENHKPSGEGYRERSKSPNGSPNGSPSRSGENIGESSGDPLGDPSDLPLNETQISPDDSPDEQLPSEPVLLTDNQAILYFCLKHISGAVTSLSHIAKATNISEHTLKSCLKKLRREHLVEYGGRCNYGGRFGFTAQINEKQIILRGDKNKFAKKIQRMDSRLLIFSEPINDQDISISPLEETNQLMNHLINNQMSHPINDRMDDPSSSSNKNKLLLQDLILEDAFLTLNPHSLLPYLERFPSSEALQDFLDMTNACITAAKHGKGKPIQNTQGFLFAQLRAGYINPPEGYKSRKVRAHEVRNQQLRDELAALQQLQEEEHQLRFTLFATALTAEQQQRLAHEIDQRLDPKGVLSPEFQTRLLREQILQEWFAHSGGTPPVPPSCASAPADAAGQHGG